MTRRRSEAGSEDTEALLSSPSGSSTTLEDGQSLNEEVKSTHDTTSSSSSLFLYASIPSFLIVLLNLFLLLRATLTPPRISDPSLLPRPEPFMGFDKLGFNATHLSQVHITNYPIVMFQVSKSEPDKIFPVDERRWLTDYGTISPDEKHFFISNDISMILQFRIQDYGMSRCTLVSDIPHPDIYRTRARGNNFHVSAGSLISVYELKTTTELDPLRTSRSNLPPRKTQNAIGMLEMHRANFSAIEEFRCESRGLRTFEIGCTKRFCHVDFWQDKDMPAMGVYLMQKWDSGEDA